MLTTHFCGNYKNNIQYRKLQGLPQINYVVGDAYRDGDIAMSRQLRMQDTSLRFFDRPRLITEYGGSWAGASHAELEADIHTGLWGSLFARQAGTPMLWWHALIHHRIGYEHYRGFANFLEGIDFRKEGFKYVAPSIIRGRGQEAFSAGTPTERYLWVANASSGIRFPDKARADVTPIENVQVELTSLQPGAFTIEWWDTFAGAKARHSASVGADGVLSLRLPPYWPDIAAKIIKRDKAGGAE